MKSIFTSLNENQKEVLNLIRVHKELSGAEIARITNLQPSTIVYIVKALSELKLIEFSKTGESTTKGGKKPTLYKINSEVGFIFGLEILLHKIKLTVIDFAGKAILMQEEEYPQGLLKEKLATEIENLVLQFLKRPGFDLKKVMGIGLAVPGLVNSRTGLIYYSRKLQLENYNLKEVIEQKLNIPTFICNDANAGVLGFRWFPGKEDEILKNVIYLIYNQESVTMGSGLLINNELYEGMSGGAGEILTSLPAIKDLIEVANINLSSEGMKDKLHPSLTLDEIISKSKQNVPSAMQVVETLCQKFADQIIAIIAFMNPEAIILGGDLSEYQNIIDDKIIPYVKFKIQEYLKYGFEMPVIKTSRFGNFSVSMGSAAIVMNEYFRL